MARERLVDVYVPVVPSAGGSVGVGPILVVPVLAVVAAVVVAVLVTVAHPGSQHQYYPRPCDPFCTTTATVSSPVAEFPFGGEQR